MKLWAKIISGAIPSFFILALFLLLYRRRWRRQQLLISPQASIHFSEPAPKYKFDSFNSNINKLILPHKSGTSARNSLRFHHLDSPFPPPETTFRWENHPRLIAVAVENGWQSFAFSNTIPRSPSSAALWALCVTCDGGTQPKSPGISWELPAGSSELMQAVRLNPPQKNNADEPSFSWVRTGLPLPGPALGGGSFPQEAYFEITIVFLKQPVLTTRKSMKNRESDRAKLIRDNSMGARSVSSNSNFAAEEGISVGIGAIALGLTSSIALPIKFMPGTYPGSIGFHSNGSLFLDERKLVFESETAEWAAVNKVIGCGFAPSKNRVFFTVDSQVAHVIRCNSEAYSSPLFPFLAANVETKLLVNLGQAPFKYTPANAARTTNPCFFRPLTGEEAGDLKIGSVVNSQELFSVARIETESIGHGGRRKNQNSSMSCKKSSGSSEDVLDGESDLFEIVLQR
ncbi:uncharacterized protein LOC110023485 [Phalaenopsis equestris]|uniref:uncharacterized protein LOC110023485 n=1 Tax=Phalaenopsis equestris TaxID=78828 RepID=UPI0009E4416E|nr:uncharacterized protein LOC110023485 [Phalaenopsis equestris]